MKELKSYVTESIPKEDNYKGVKILVSPRAASDFSTYAGLKAEDAVEFLHLLLDELGDSWGPKDNPKMTAELFYSGYAGWALEDTSRKQIGYLMYDSNVYGLEDAHQGIGWHFDDRNLSHKFDRKDMEAISKAIEVIGKKYKPGKVRM